MREMEQQKKSKRYLPQKEAEKGRPLYIVYRYSLSDEDMVSEGPFIKKDEAYDMMTGFLKEGLCSWVVVYND
jgi:hypothetical protein|tara:strand:- start:4916 stop:5131 length:216 start_codon:yes stop_codon:yes gene_type:complete